jgi:hypothetical protein
MTSEEFTHRYGISPDEARDAEQAEFATFSREEQLHIIRAIKMADSFSNAASTMAAGIAAIQAKGSSRLGAALVTTKTGYLAQAYLAALVALKRLIPRDGEATATTAFLRDLIWLPLRELEQA